MRPIPHHSTPLLGSCVYRRQAASERGRHTLRSAVVLRTSPACAGLETALQLHRLLPLARQGQVTSTAKERSREQIWPDDPDSQRIECQDINQSTNVSVAHGLISAPPWVPDVAAGSSQNTSCCCFLSLLPELMLPGQNTDKASFSVLAAVGVLSTSCSPEDQRRGGRVKSTATAASLRCCAGSCAARIRTAGSWQRTLSSLAPARCRPH